MSRKDVKSLLAVVALAGVLRIAMLDSLPIGLFRDEAEKVMNALSIAERGADLNGNSWPVFIKVFQVTTSATYQYLSAILVLVFGANEWTARLPAALAATATVGITWGAVRILYGFTSATLAAGLLAVSPWHIPLSRWAHQGILIPLFLAMILLSLAIIQKHRETGKISLGPFAVAGLAAGLAFYTYDVARLIVPLLAIAAAVLWHRVIMGKPVILLITAVAFLLTASPVIYLLITDQASAQTRFRFVTIAQPGLSTFEVIQQFIANYFNHWSPDFLLWNGDRNLRHGAGVGILNPAEIVGVLALIYYVVRNRNDLFAKFVLAGILVFPVASSLTRVDVPHALRSITGIPFFAVAAGISIPWLYRQLPKRAQTAGLVVVSIPAIASLAYFNFIYFGPDYKSRSAQYWEYGIREALEVANSPALADATIVFDNVLGYEYLAPFHLRLSASETARFHRHPRYKARFRNPAAVPPAIDTAPTVYLSFPGQNWPPHWSGIGISPPSAGNLPPVFFVIMNTPAAQLYNQL